MPAFYTYKDIKMDLRFYLNKYFGYSEFRNGQEEIISSIINKRDTLAIMPTGGGKSICYQLPALLLDGMTIVISPLISLMKDQVDQLKELNIKAELLNSTLDDKDYSLVIEKLKNNEIKILYISPERLDSANFVELISKNNIEMVAIDEAHCISQWGHDFRPSYRNIKHFINKITTKPIVSAFTATATQTVRDDIINQLSLINPFIKVNSFDRENIRFLLKEPSDKFSELIKDLDKDKSTIVYANTRKKVEELKNNLEINGYSVNSYHAGITKESREKSQDEFIKDKKSIMVATNAFGMGIDKPDVRKVIHYNMPKNLESYYQEAGRAGRDGDFAEAILYFSRGDVVQAKWLINRGNDPTALEKLNQMVGYTRESNCLRNYILNYFGEKRTEQCGNCSACLEDYNTLDVSLESKKIISCVYRCEERFGMGLISKVLKGSNDKQIRTWKLQDLSTYGIMSEYNIDQIKDIISHLISQKILNQGEFSILKLTNKSSLVLKNQIKVTMREPVKSQNIIKKEENILYPELYEILRLERAKIATSKNVPPYVVFSNSVLRDLTNNLPSNNDEFLDINGIGESKAFEYGEIFLEIINNYVKENNIKRSPKKINKKKRRYLGNSEFQTLELLNKGISLEEIAKIRGLAFSTVSGHVFHLIKNGHNIDYKSNVDEDTKLRILEAIEKVGTDKLKDIKEIVDEKIEYDEIKSVVLEYLSKKNLN